MQKWDEYPGNVGIYFPVGIDRGSYHDLLYEGSMRLFERSTIDIEAFQLCRGTVINNSAVHTRNTSGSLGSLKIPAEDTEGIYKYDLIYSKIDDAERLAICLKIPQVDEHHIFFIIPQKYSWGRLQTTRAAFLHILAEYQVFALFLNIVSEFGFKTHDRIPQKETFHSHFRLPSVKHNLCSPAPSYEVSYILWFVEQNDAELWTLRQTGVYQQFNHCKMSSLWIILQSRSTRHSLEKILSSSNEFTAAKISLNVHARLLLGTVGNWAKYSDHMNTKLERVTDKAWFSKIGTNIMDKYEITFSDIQVLERLRCKIDDTSIRLDACLDTASRLKVHCLRYLKEAAITDCDTDETISAMDAYIVQITLCRRGLETMIKTLEGTYNLIIKIIEFRNIEKLRNINAASELSILLLKDSTVQMYRENQVASKLSVQSYKDAKTLKALAVVSIIFLPASLIATIFSSNLIQSKQVEGTTSNETYFVLSQQFWVYICISVILTIISAGCSWTLKTQWVKKVLLEELQAVTASP